MAGGPPPAALVPGGIVGSGGGRQVSGAEGHDRPVTWSRQVPALKIWSGLSGMGDLAVLRGADIKGL